MGVYVKVKDNCLMPFGGIYRGTVLGIIFFGFDFRK